MHIDPSIEISGYRDMSLYISRREKERKDRTTTTTTTTTKTERDLSKRKQR